MAFLRECLQAVRSLHPDDDALPLIERKSKNKQRLAQGTNTGTTDDHHLPNCSSLEDRCIPGVPSTVERHMGR